MIDFSKIPDSWFVYAMGEQVEPIHYKGDTHDLVCFYCELQHRDGGKLTRGEGQTLHEALNQAVQRVERKGPETVL